MEKSSSLGFMCAEKERGGLGVFKKSGRKGLKRKSFLYGKFQTPIISYGVLLDKCYPDEVGYIRHNI